MGIDGVQLRAIDAGEFPAFYARMMRSLGLDPGPEDEAVFAGVCEPSRTLAGFDRGQVVATSALMGRQLTLPGGVAAPVAVGMMAAVAPTHRRRGLLREIKRQQAVALREQEGIMLSCPSEAAIYGRFGYGLATRRAVLTAESQQLQVRPELVSASLVVEERDMPEAVGDVAELYARVASTRVGWPARSGPWWQLRVHDPAMRDSGLSALRLALCLDAGRACAYVLYRIANRWTGSPDSEVQVLELVAESGDGYAALWRFVLELDLVRHVRWDCAAPDEPLQLMVTDARALRLTGRDGLWVWLVDLPRALAARRYAREIDVVLDVVDEFCEWNSGRWRLCGDASGAFCERTSAAPDVRLRAADVAAAFLGGVSIAELATAVRAEELRKDMVRALSAAMVCDPRPSCPETF